MTTSRHSTLPTWDATGFRDAVQRSLTDFVDEQGSRLSALGPEAERLVNAAREAVAGGKRLRASFCYWGFRAVREHGYDEEQLVRAAAALELLQASALVHDDYMDASDVRRGRPATHRAFESWHREEDWAGDAERYGASAAILLGDLLLAWSDEALRTSGFPAERVLEALRYFDTTRSEVITGQFLDVSAQARRATGVEDAMRVLRYKSAKYSVERPLHIGAALAGAPAAVFESLTAFGLPLGEAFQLRDDLLGVFGDPEVTGKPAGDDLVEGKRTLLVVLALEHAPAEDARRLHTALGTPLAAGEVDELRRIIRDAGAHTRVEATIHELTEQCLDALQSAPISETARTALRKLAVAATQRTV